MPEYLLGIDNGSTMTKAALYALDGEELAVAARKVVVMEPEPGISERDANRLWDDVAAVVNEVLDVTGVDPAAIAGVACSGHGNGLCLVDREGNPVRNNIYATDTRARAYVDRWSSDGTRERTFPKTTQRLWAGQPNALLAWTRDNEPETIERAFAFQCVKDFVRSKLTGEIRLERTDMSGCSLINVGTGEYDDELLELFGIADLKRLLPPMIDSHDPAGKVTAEAAARTGLKAGTPLAGGMFDIDACALSSGIVDERPMSVVAGTWGNNLYIAREPLVDPDLFMTTCYSMPGWYLMLEGSPTSAGNLEWFASEFLAAEREALERQGQSVFAFCADLVDSVSPEETPITFLPFLHGANAGDGVKSCLVGMEGHHRRAHVLRAIFEGVVFGHRTHLERLLKFRSTPDVIRLSGGAARSETWVQIFTDCFQIPIEVTRATEPGALGAAMAAGIAAGCFAGYEEATAAMTGIARRQEPDPAKQDIYQQKYERYHEIIAALSGPSPS